jgi:hypothetical protein
MCFLAQRTLSHIWKAFAKSSVAKLLELQFMREFHNVCRPRMQLGSTMLNTRIRYRHLLSCQIPCLSRQCLLACSPPKAGDRASWLSQCSIPNHTPEVIWDLATHPPNNSRCLCFPSALLQDDSTPDADSLRRHSCPR